jgi:hypothetical protein
MTLVDRLEKIGRLVLWLTLAATCVIIPLEYGKRQAAAQREVSAAEKAQQALKAQLEELQEAAAADSDEGPERITLESVGPAMRRLDEDRAQALIWFTNVSARAGIICIVGKAANPSAARSAVSLPACRALAPYESNVNMTVQFAGSDLASACKGGDCQVGFVDAKDSPNTRDVD